MNGLDKEKLLQVSMDGPSVNTKFLSNLNEERRDQDLSQLVSIEIVGYTLFITRSRMARMPVAGN